jgi:hypothetical protein
VLFQLRRDRILPGRHVPGDAQKVGLTADLAILDVALAASGGGIDEGLVPFSASGALETCGHIEIGKNSRQGCPEVTAG